MQMIYTHVTAQSVHHTNKGAAQRTCKDNANIKKAITRKRAAVKKRLSWFASFTVFDIFNGAAINRLMSNGS